MRKHKTYERTDSVAGGPIAVESISGSLVVVRRRNRPFEDCRLFEVVASATILGSRFIFEEGTRPMPPRGTMNLSLLVSRVLKGDPEAKKQLIEMTRPEVIPILSRSFPNAVEDAWQETVTRILERLHQLKKPELFFHWAKKIAKNCKTDTHREQHRYGTSLDDNADGTVAAASWKTASVDTPEELFRKTEILGRLRTFPQGRIVIYLSRDHTYAEAAQRFGTNISAIFAARKMVAKYVRDLLNLPPEPDKEEADSSQAESAVGL